jgi:hypothetical protein
MRTLPVNPNAALPTQELVDDYLTRLAASQVPGPAEVNEAAKQHAEQKCERARCGSEVRVVLYDHAMEPLCVLELNQHVVYLLYRRGGFVLVSESRWPTESSFLNQAVTRSAIEMLVTGRSAIGSSKPRICLSMRSASDTKSFFDLFRGNAARQGEAFSHAILQAERW